MSFLGGLFGGNSDKGYKKAQGYLNQMGPMLQQQYNPYIQAGQQQLPQLQQQYGNLMNNPGAVQQQLGQGYQQSPGYEFQLQEALNAINQANAAGGMLGTAAHQRQAGGVGQGLANQDYWNYYNQNANLFGQGLQGAQGLYNTGYDASNQLAGGMGNVLGSQANLAYTRGQNKDSMINSLLGAGIGAAGYALGGPLGGLAAGGLSKLFSGQGSGLGSGMATNGMSSGGWFNPGFGGQQIGNLR